MEQTRIERRKELIWALVALLCLAPSAERRAEARSCSPPPPIEREFAVSSAVFVGTIIATEVQEGVELIGTQTVATFSVERTWKGTSGRAIRVATPGGDHVIFSTGLSFKSGERYVVFASGPFPSAITCSRPGTKSHYLWNETIEWLERQPSKLAG
jgi:hypothetical protein